MISIVKTIYSLMLLSLLLPLSLSAEISTERPGAILVFPKVVSTATEETIIQLTNATGIEVDIRCFYIDGRIESETQESLWLVTDFRSTLTMQQPAVWVASEGLPAIAPDRPLELFPGPIPPVSDGFTGELRCMVVDDSERPISRNALTGNVSIINRASGLARKYQGLAFQGLPGNDNNNTLLLNEIEYSSCPRVILVNHFFDSAMDPVTSDSLQTNLVMVPCSLDLERSIPGSADLQFDVFNEFEQRLSANLSIVCFEDIALGDISAVFDVSLQGTLVGHTRVRSVVDEHTDHGHGILAIVEEFRDGIPSTSSNLHFVGGALQSDVMILTDPF